MSQLHDDNLINIKELTEEQAKNKYFHCRLKGCEMVARRIKASVITGRSGNAGFGWINGYWCKTHKKLCCRCGICWGHHFLKVGCKKRKSIV